MPATDFFVLQPGKNHCGLDLEAEALEARAHTSLRECRRIFSPSFTHMA
jgi:hypothetical protein